MTTPSPTTSPVTVVGGFLGAGKTTFLNHLLTSSGARYAVLVNDFGAVNIDAGLIARHDGATTTLTNGCVCCSIGGGFIETLGNILDAKTPFDHIIIEASGVSDPWRIAEIALVEPSLRLNAVIVLADASRIASLLTDARVGDTIRNQFAHCDLVLLNKIDLTDRAGARSASAAISALRAGLRIVETTAHTMPDLPVGQHGVVSRFRAIETFDSPDHENQFRRWTYRRRGVFDCALLKEALAQLPPQLLRLKGHCRLLGETKPSLLQMVGPDWSLSTMQEQATQDDILLVGVGTDHLPATAGLNAILDRALAVAAPSKMHFHSPREGQSSCL